MAGIQKANQKLNSEGGLFKGLVPRQEAVAEAPQARLTINSPPQKRVDYFCP